MDQCHGIWLIATKSIVTATAMYDLKLKSDVFENTHVRRMT